MPRALEGCARIEKQLPAVKVPVPTGLND